MSKKLLSLLLFALLPLVGCNDTANPFVKTDPNCNVSTSCSMTSDGTCASCCDHTNDADCSAPTPACDVSTDCSMTSDGTCASCCDHTNDADCSAPTPACDVSTSCSMTSDGTCASCCDHTNDADCSAPTPACDVSTDCSMTSDGTCASCCDHTNDADCKLDANIGIACTADDQCGSEGKCITEASNANYTGGYCTAEVADPANPKCPDGSVVKRVDGKELCLKSCTDSTSCGRNAGDYRCEENVCVPNLCGASCGDDKTCLVYDVTSAKPSAKAVCVSKCDATSSSPCANGEVCSPVFGYRDTYCMQDCSTNPDSCTGDFACIASPDPSKKICYTQTINTKIQTECEIDADCGPEGKCNAQQLNGVTYYKGACVGKVVDGRDTCPDGSRKSGSPARGYSCVKSCTDATLDQDCRDSNYYRCESLVCFPKVASADKDSEKSPVKKCPPDSVCTTAGEKCLDIDATGVGYCRVPSTGTKKVGEFCSSYEECGGGSQAACRLYDRVAQTGYCTKTCNDSTLSCGTGEFCESFGSTAKYCLLDCTNDPSVCGSTGEFKCTTSRADGTKKVCKPSPLYKRANADNIGAPCTKDSDCGDKEGVCLYPSSEFPNGYCSYKTGAGRSCPEGSYEKNDFFKGSYCAKACSAADVTGECRDAEGYKCMAHSGHFVCLTK